MVPCTGNDWFGLILAHKAGEDGIVASKRIIYARDTVPGYDRSTSDSRDVTSDKDMLVR